MSVLSGSMEPAIKTGSIVIVKPAADYKVGDIITFGKISRTQTPITHRINEIKGLGATRIFITKGDANNAPDSKEVRLGEIVGKEILTVPYVGYAINTAKKPWGFALIIMIPALLIVFDEGKKIWDEIIKIKNNKKNEIQNQEN